MDNKNFELYASAANRAVTYHERNGQLVVRFRDHVSEQKRARITAWLRANREAFLDWVFPPIPDWTDDEYDKIPLEGQVLANEIERIFKGF